MQTDPPALRLQLQLNNESQIIDTLFAKFREVHDATGWHFQDTRTSFSPNPSNFGDTWKYLQFQDKWIKNYLPQTSKKADFGSKLEAKIWSQNEAIFRRVFRICSRFVIENIAC